MPRNTFGGNKAKRGKNRRPVDGVTHVAQVLTQRVNIGGFIGQMAEIAPTLIILGIPVIGQLDRTFFLPLGREEDEGKAPAFVLVAAGFLEAEAVAVEALALFDIPDPNHGVEVAHGECSCLSVCGCHKPTPARRECCKKKGPAGWRWLSSRA